MESRQRMDESDQRIKKNLAELSKNIGGLGNSIGHVIEGVPTWDRGRPRRRDMGQRTSRPRFNK